MKNKIVLMFMALCVTFAAMAACSTKNDEAGGINNAKETAVESQGISGENTAHKSELTSEGTEPDVGAGNQNGAVVVTDADTGKDVANAGVKKDPQDLSAAPVVPDGKTNGSVDSAGNIGVERAKEIALEKAGITSDGVFFEKVELDRDDRLLVYELEFKKDGFEYEIEIKADDGTVLSWEKDRDD